MFIILRYTAYKRVYLLSPRVAKDNYTVGELDGKLSTILRKFLIKF